MPSAKRQVFIVPGGDSFKKRSDYVAFLKGWRIDFNRYLRSKASWKSGLQVKLGSGYEVIVLDMPNRMDAKYEDWSIWFEKFIPHMRPGLILVGHSLGALFLIKYLSENSLAKRISGTMLVAAPLGEGDFPLKADLSRLPAQCGEIFLYQSEDDPVVEYSHQTRLREFIPSAKARVFKKKGHFNQGSFPELVRDIKRLGNKKTG